MIGIHHERLHWVTLCRPCQPPDALSASSARPEPVDSVAMTTTGMPAVLARSPAQDQLSVTHVWPTVGSPRLDIPAS